MRFYMCFLDLSIILLPFYYIPLWSLNRLYNIIQQDLLDVYEP